MQPHGGYGSSQLLAGWGPFTETAKIPTRSRLSSDESEWIRWENALSLNSLLAFREVATTRRFRFLN